MGKNIKQRGTVLLENISIGTDIEEIKRFEGKETNFTFLSKVFTTPELEYSLKTKSPAQHLCARFCAKEAIVKALTGLDIKDVYYSDIEIINRKDGLPCAKIAKYPNLKIKVSLSHCKDYATANTIIEKL